MDTKTAELIEKLAQKLGTTSEYLWGVLINQAKVSAFTSLVLVVFTLIFGIVLYKLHKRFSKKGTYNELDDLTVAPMVVLALVFVISLGCSAYKIPNIINGFLNPEYWALKEVLDQIK